MVPATPSSAVDQQTIERVKAYKARRKASPTQYRDRPRLAFIVHSFNRIANLDQLIGGLRSVGDHELIVCEDGSLDGSYEKWRSLLDRPNDFLIHSNDLHEIRVLDRAISFARSDIVCLVQDDDRIPHETAWLDAALGQFTQHPDLAILGGFMGAVPLRSPRQHRPILHPETGLRAASRTLSGRSAWSSRSAEPAGHGTPASGTGAGPTGKQDL